MLKLVARGCDLNTVGVYTEPIGVTEHVHRTAYNLYNILVQLNAPMLLVNLLLLLSRITFGCNLLHNINRVSNQEA